MSNTLFLIFYFFCWGVIALVTKRDQSKHGQKQQGKTEHKKA
jgi:hypothetical protein